jgi:hypothetical protein
VIINGWCDKGKDMEMEYFLLIANRDKMRKRKECVNVMGMN